MGMRWLQGMSEFEWLIIVERGVSWYLTIDNGRLLLADKIDWIVKSIGEKLKEIENMSSLHCIECIYNRKT